MSHEKAAYPNIKQVSVKKFAQDASVENSAIHSDGYRIYIPELKGFSHEHKTYNSRSGPFHWLYIMIGNAKALFWETITVCHKDHLRFYLTNFVSVSAVAPLILDCLIAWFLLSALLAS